MFQLHLDAGPGLPIAIPIFETELENTYQGTSISSIDAEQRNRRFCRSRRRSLGVAPEGGSGSDCGARSRWPRGLSKCSTWEHCVKERRGVLDGLKAWWSLRLQMLAVPMKFVGGLWEKRWLSLPFLANFLDFILPNITSSLFVQLRVISSDYIVVIFGASYGLTYIFRWKRSLDNYLLYAQNPSPFRPARRYFHPCRFFLRTIITLPYPISIMPGLCGLYTQSK